MVFQVVFGVDFQGYMYEGVILFVVGYLSGIQLVGVVVDFVDWKDVGGGQCFVDFGEQFRQIGLFVDVVGIFGDKMWYGVFLCLCW